MMIRNEPKHSLTLYSRYLHAFGIKIWTKSTQHALSNKEEFKVNGKGCTDDAYEGNEI